MVKFPDSREFSNNKKSYMLNTLWGKPTLNVQVDLSGRQTIARHEVSWYELVYDLAYVAAISSLGTNQMCNLYPAATIRDNPNWESLFKFITLFVPLIWAWRSTQKYVDRFGGNDILLFTIHYENLNSLNISFRFCFFCWI